MRDTDRLIAAGPLLLTSFAVIVYVLLSHLYMQFLDVLQILTTSTLEPLLTESHITL